MKISIQQPKQMEYKNENDRLNNWNVSMLQSKFCFQILFLNKVSARFKITINLFFFLQLVSYLLNK